MSNIFSVYGQTMTPTSTMEKVVTGSNNFAKFKFVFDSQWDSFEKYAIFKQGSKEYVTPLDASGAYYTATLPSSLTPGECELLVEGRAVEGNDVAISESLIVVGTCLRTTYPIYAVTSGGQTQITIQELTDDGAIISYSYSNTSPSSLGDHEFYTVENSNIIFLNLNKEGGEHFIVRYNTSGRPIIATTNIVHFRVEDNGLKEPGVSTFKLSTNVYAKLDTIERKLTVYGTGEMPLYNEYTSRPPWDFYPDKIFDSVEIESGITSVGNYAFYNNQNITSVILTNTVTTIQTHAFFGCANLKRIEGSLRGLTNIGAYAFESCSNLERIAISSSGAPNLTSIGIDAFYGCSNLSDTKYITNRMCISSGVEIIPSYAFYLCNNASYFEFSGNISSIGNMAFYKNTPTTLSFVHNTQVPSINTSSLTGIIAGSRIIVPQSLYDSWTTNPQWVAAGVVQYIEAA